MLKNGKTYSKNTKGQLIEDRHGNYGYGLPDVASDVWFRGEWEVAYGYSGMVDTTATAWVIERIRPNNGTAAADLWAIRDLITQVVEENGTGVGTRVRLEANKNPAGNWVIREYDFGKWTATLLG